MAEASPTGCDHSNSHIPEGLLEQLVVPRQRHIRPEHVERGRRLERARTYDNRDVVHQVAAELLRVSAAFSVLIPRTFVSG
jgi:hypothetical protein